MSAGQYGAQPSEQSRKYRTIIDWKYTEGDTNRICAKVIEVFGVGTTAVVEISV
jgi:hypothetical protein